MSHERTASMYRIQELATETVNHVAAAAYAADEIFELQKDAEEHWQLGEKERNKLIERIHLETLSCLQAFHSLSETCGRPMARRYSKEDPLNADEGDRKKVELIQKAIGSLMQEVKTASGILKSRLENKGVSLIEYDNTPELGGRLLDEEPIDRRISKNETSESLKPVGKAIEEVEFISDFLEVGSKEMMFDQFNFSKYPKAEALLQNYRQR